MIDVFLCRHGEASFDATSDRTRPLTEFGLETTKQRVDEFPADLKARITTIWSSDLLRAQQTASCFADVLAIKPQYHPFLRPESDPEKVIKKLSECPQPECVLLVAHMPLLGDLFSLLVEGHQFTPYSFQTSEVVHLRGELVAAGLMEHVNQI